MLVVTERLQTEFQFRTEILARALENRRRDAKVRAKNEIDTAADESRDGSGAATQIDQLDLKSMFLPDPLVRRHP